MYSSMKFTLEQNVQKKKKHIIYQKREVLILRAIKNINHAAKWAK